MSTTLVVDNGAGMLKAGLLPEKMDAARAELPVAPVRLPNCTAKSRAEKKFFVADGLDTAVELSALYIRRPHDRGYVVNWDLEGDVWQRMCHADVLGVKPGETSVLVTEPLFCPAEVRDNMDEFIFEVCVVVVVVCVCRVCVCVCVKHVTVDIIFVDKGVDLVFRSGRR
jgi:actin-related protein 6